MDRAKNPQAQQPDVSTVGRRFESALPAIRAAASRAAGNDDDDDDGDDVLLGSDGREGGSGIGGMGMGRRQRSDGGFTNDFKDLKYRLASFVTRERRSRPDHNLRILRHGRPSITRTRCI